MDDALKRIVYGKLQDDGVLSEDWSTLVIGACEGPEELASALGGDASAGDVKTPPAEEEGEPVGAYLTGITVQGFRGIGDEATLKLSPGPGLTLVVGRNGSGKSSFAEGLEVLFTGDSGRWANRSKVWQEGWRNLHHPHPAFVEAEIVVEEGKPTRVQREWEADADVLSSKSSVQEHGKPKAGLESLGWTAALKNYRPFLSYNELGSMLDEGPSKLYDALSVVLGLEDLVGAQELLRQERLGRKKALDQAKAGAKQLIERASPLANEEGDARAANAIAQLHAKTWDLTALEELAVGSGDGVDDKTLGILRRTCAVEPPNAVAVRNAAAELREAVDGVKELEGTDAARALEIATLLDKALTFHEHHDAEDCPVCGRTGALDANWKEQTKAEVERLRAEAQKAEIAKRALVAAEKQARGLLLPPPRVLQDAAEVELDTSGALIAWKAWNALGEVEDAGELAERLEESVDLLVQQVQEVCKKAETEVRRREDRWQPIALDLAAWIPGARNAQEGADRMSDITKAEKWVQGAAATVRDERFAPIAEKAIATWKQLRQQSNVELGKVALAGATTTRKVALEVNVDGVEGAALSVMSQGELNSLALSLFLPRATMSESPFRFVVIDDPVQSMDPSRVDGLARVLDEAAETHQVVVFTHDDRLPEAARRLGVKARVIEVHRRQNSVVELKESQHPVQTYLEDAFALAKTKDLPTGVARQVVPGFCRSAIEAAAMEVVRRRRLRAGARHTDVEELLTRSGKLRTLLALALFDDEERGVDVPQRLEKEFGNKPAHAFREANRGAHEGSSVDLLDLARATEKLTEGILRIKA